MEEVNLAGIRDVINIWKEDYRLMTAQRSGTVPLVHDNAVAVGEYICVAAVTVGSSMVAAVKQP